MKPGEKRQTGHLHCPFFSLHPTPAGDSRALARGAVGGMFPTAVVPGQNALGSVLVANVGCFQTESTNSLRAPLMWAEWSQPQPLSGPSSEPFLLGSRKFGLQALNSLLQLQVLLLPRRCLVPLCDKLSPSCPRTADPTRSFLLSWTLSVGAFLRLLAF